MPGQWLPTWQGRSGLSVLTWQDRPQVWEAWGLPGSRCWWPHHTQPPRRIDRLKDRYPAKINTVRWMNMYIYMNNMHLHFFFVADHPYNRSIRSLQHSPCPTSWWGRKRRGCGPPCSRLCPENDKSLEDNLVHIFLARLVSMWTDWSGMDYGTVCTTL